MNRDKRAILEQYYEECEGDEGWYRCKKCGVKVYATTKRAEELAKHELREHPER
jgi:tRNA(Ile2) C34 agmatinyltransferase TiaS